MDVLVREIFRTEYGDWDLNGKVDFADFLTLSANFGTDRKAWTDGDANGDGHVEFSDFLQLAQYFGFNADGD